MGIPPRPMIGGNRGGPPPVPPRPAGIMITIASGQIKSVDELAGGMNPIWLVTMSNSPKNFVIKKERNFRDGAGAAVPSMQVNANIKAMNNIMSVASAKTDMVPLSPQEASALASFQGSPPSIKSAVQEANAKQCVLIKMYQDASFTSTSNKGAEGDGFPDRIMTDDDKMKSRSMFNKLRGNRLAWQSLGKVAIADALIGNNDRLAWDPPPQVVNFGNLIFSTNPKGDITHALGYDTIDPSQFEAKLMHGQDIGTWTDNFGQYIRDKSKFPGVAMAWINDIKLRRLDPLGMAPYTSGEAAALGEGLMIGWDKQANTIGAAVRAGKGVPSGIMARAKYLGWVK